MYEVLAAPALKASVFFAGAAEWLNREYRKTLDRTSAEWVGRDTEQGKVVGVALPLDPACVCVLRVEKGGRESYVRPTEAIDHEAERVLATIMDCAGPKSFVLNLKG
jgi:hypothetical protein